MPYAFGPRDAVEFPARCARWLIEAARDHGTPTDQGAGCRLRGGPGQLRVGARLYGEVLGVDLSRAFIDAADTLRRQGELRYFRKDEGTLGTTLSAMIDPGHRPRPGAVSAKPTPARCRLN
jgi:hypothetical protein